MTDIGRWLFRATGLLVLGLGMFAARAADPYVVKLDHLRYEDGAGRLIDYGFDSGVIVQSDGRDAIALPAGAILGRGAGEQATTFFWAEAPGKDDTNPTLAGGQLYIGVEQSEPREIDAVWSLSPSGTVAPAPNTWSLQADFTGFAGVDGDETRTHEFTIGESSPTATIRPEIRGMWFSGWHEGIHYTNILVVQASIENDQGEWWDSEEVIIPGLNPATAAIGFSLQVSGGVTLTASYRLGHAAWQPIGQHTITDGQMPGLAGLYPLVRLRTMPMGITEMQVDRGQLAGNASTREYGLEITGGALKGVQVTTPWGATFNSADYLPVGWDGDEFRTENDGPGLHFEVENTDDGLVQFDIWWQSLTTTQWNAVNTTAATIAVQWESGNWTGSVGFGASPMPTQTPVVTYPTAGATGVELRPVFLWNTWTGPGTQEPGIHWELDVNEWQTVFEEQHEPTSTAGWQPAADLLPGTEYEFVVGFHHAPLVTVNGQDVRVISWLDSAHVDFTTAGEAALYAVWAGNTNYTGNPDAFYNPQNTDYTLLGTAGGTATFTGNYNYYVIVPTTQVHVDAIQGPGATWFQGSLWTGNTDNWDRLTGAPDTLAASIRGYAMFANPGGWDSITIWTMTDPAPQPDLIVQLGNSTVQATPGAQVMMPVTVRNIGIADAAGFWSTALYISTDASFDPMQDSVVASFDMTYLSPSQSDTRNLSFTAPTTPGTYYLIAVTDRNEQLAEAHENDNWSLFSTLTVGAGGAVVYVREGGTGNGSSWDNARGSLQDALAVVPPGGQVWIAAGTYKPAGLGGPRTSAFTLPVDVALYGGFGGSETSLDDRNPVVFPTVLSGDLNGDDSTDLALDESSRQDNSYHVVVAHNRATLDGLTIADGNAGADAGGGIYCDTDELIVNNCVIRRNRAQVGAGMANVNASPTIVDSRFEFNVGVYGGGMHNQGSGPRVTGCTFFYNQVEILEGVGGGVANVASSPSFAACTFTANSAFRGGGVANLDGAAPSFTDCRFEINTGASGGGMYSQACTPALDKCAFVRNAAPAVGSLSGVGAGIANDMASPNLVNCIVIQNSAAGAGGGIWNNGSMATLMNCDVVANSPGGMFGLNASAAAATNSIFWGNTGSQLGGDPVTITYSCVQGGAAGTGNIGGDPLFTDAPGGHLQLQAGSPCIDAGTATGAPAVDLDGNTRDASPDIGAYEYVVIGPAAEIQYTLVTGYNLIGIPLTGTGLNNAADLLAWAPNATAAYALVPGSQTWAAYTTDGGANFSLQPGMAVFIACSQAGAVTLSGNWIDIPSHAFALPGGELLCLPHNLPGYVNTAGFLMATIPSDEGVWRWLPDQQRWSGYHAGFGGDDFPVAPGTAVLVTVDAPGTWIVPTP